ncbi:trypsin-like serine protease [Chitinophaga deserti]|uniref:trypsin-like serine protease n=1 Tax=Chitinophaga deserti TaxID=2164099 RepID=UPI0013006CD3|nr:trypsin-like serine protease [Chitinophaga deserti]
MQLTKQIEQTDIEPHMSALRGWLRGNIVGMYAGPKRKNGHKTDQCSVVFHVQHKKSADRIALDGDEAIPPFLELPIAQNGGKPVMVKVPTDVQEVGPFRDDAEPVAKPEPMASWDRIRPAPGGQQVQPQGINMAGTLGASFNINGQYRMLSNNHVLSYNGQYTRIYQPDVSQQQNYLCDVSGFINLITYPNSNQFNPIYNTTDLAWCNTTPLVCSPAINGIGTPVGFAAPAANMQVSCYGATTDEVMHTSIVSVHYQGVMRIMGQYAWFQDAIWLNGDNFAPLPGDSGSILVNNQLQMVGILTATNVFGAMACLIPTQLIH